MVYADHQLEDISMRAILYDLRKVIFSLDRFEQLDDAGMTQFSQDQRLNESLMQARFLFQFLYLQSFQDIFQARLIILDQKYLSV